MRSRLRSRIGRAFAGGAVVLLLAGPVAAQQAPPPPVPVPVILTVDMQQILKDAKAAKGAQGVINQQYASYSKQVAQQEDDLQKARADLERQRTILAPEAFNNRAKELQQKYDELSQVFQGKRQALQQSYNEAMIKVENMALEVVADIVKERKANLVLQKQAVLFEAEGLDITADAMARLDLKLPSVQVNVPKDNAEAAAGAAASGKKH